MNHQILIASYKPDFPWLACALASIKQCATGFLPPVVAVTFSDYADALALAKAVGSDATIAVKEGLGNLRAQIAMMQGDLLCPVADIVHLWGSDCIAVQPFTPEDFMYEGKPVMPIAGNTWLEAHHPAALGWRKGTFETLGWWPDWEYMRRIPLLYPTKLFPQVRNYIEKRHNRPFEDHVYWTGAAGTGHFSESNIMGAYAHQFVPHLYSWVIRETTAPQPFPVVQFWSHGGMYKPMDTDFITPCGHTLGKTPGLVIGESISALPPVEILKPMMFEPK